MLRIQNQSVSTAARAAALAVAFGSAVFVATGEAGAQTTAIIASTGDAAPDGNGAFSSLNGAPLNDAGQAVFLASLTGTTGGSSDDRGIFRGDGATGPAQIVREGQAAPDGNGAFSFLVNPVLNNAGQAAFRALLTGTTGGTSDDEGLFRGDGTGGPVQIAREGQAAPGGDGAFSGFTNIPALNDAGQAAFFASLSGTSGGTSDNSGIFRGDGVSGPVQIARKGQAAPGGDGAFSDFTNPALNNAGQAAFRGDLTATSGGSSDDEGIFRGDGTGGPVQIARAGQAAPDANGIFSRFGGTPALNDAGQTAFRADFTATSGGSSDDEGIFRGDGLSGPVQIARAGQPAPDGNGAFSIFINPTLNNAGQTAFLAFLTGTSGAAGDDGGLFRGDDGLTAPTQIAREGQAAPDANGAFASFVGNPTLNDAGQAAFLASLTGTSGGESDDLGLFLYDDLLGLLTVAHEGDAFLGSTITGLGFSLATAPGDEASGLNNLGQVAYRYDLADGNSGIAVFTVPEPSSLSLLALGGLALLRRRRGADA